MEEVNIDRDAHFRCLNKSRLRSAERSHKAKYDQANGFPPHATWPRCSVCIRTRCSVHFAYCEKKARWSPAVAEASPWPVNRSVESWPLERNSF